jgi:hypothetical protein
MRCVKCDLTLSALERIVNAQRATHPISAVPSKFSVYRLASVVPVSIISSEPLGSVDGILPSGDTVAISGNDTTIYDLQVDSYLELQE